MAYKAFVSSTFQDLPKNRAHVIAALRDAGFFVDPMENWTAAAQEPKVFSQQRVAGCDLCVLLEHLLGREQICAFGGSHDLRFFGNLVALASAERALGSVHAARPLVREAEELARSLGLSADHALRRIREDVAALNELRTLVDEMHLDPTSADLNLHGLRIPAAHAGRIAALIAELKSRPANIYPWPGLENRLRGDAATHLPLFGYGSLISTASAARTISSLPPAEANRPPVIGFGVRRLFNYEMPANLLQPYATPLDSPARGALNVQVTHDIHDAINGVLVHVSAADLDALRERERGYDLAPIVCLPWENRTAEPFVAFVLTAPDEPRLARRWTSDAIEPHPEYLKLCLEAARMVSQEFLNFFLATTFLADGRTLMKTPDL